MFKIPFTNLYITSREKLLDIVKAEVRLIKEMPGNSIEDRDREFERKNVLLTAELTQARQDIHTLRTTANAATAKLAEKKVQVRGKP
jgi:hypothetical protein